MYVLGPVLTPFAAAALVAYLGDPLVDRLQRWGLSRTMAVVVVFAAMTLLVGLVLLLLLPLLVRQIGHLVEQLPHYVEWLRVQLEPMLVRYAGLAPGHLDGAQLVELLQSHWREASGVAAGMVGVVARSGSTVLAWLANLLVIPVVVFYLLRDWDLLLVRVHELLPRHLEPTVTRLARESDGVLGAFLRGQLLVMLALSAFYVLGLWAVGLDLALLIGMGAGLVSFVPYLGAIVGIGTGVIAAFVQYQDWLHPLLVMAVFALGQTLEGTVLTPKLVGDRIGMHPVAVIFAVLAGGQLFGFLGILVALPVAAVAMVLLRHAHERYLASGLYGAAPAVPAPAAGAKPPDSPPA
jgi:predicted PurR-regulated permease PerM